jgi:hypothetical protein
VRAALVLPDDAFGPTARAAETLATALSAAGHEVETVAVRRTVRAPFPGHPGEPGRPRPLDEAPRPDARFDVVASLGAPDLVLPPLVDLRVFRPAPPRAGASPPRVLVAGDDPEDVAFALRVAALAPGVEVWRVGARRGDAPEPPGVRGVEPGPAEATAALLRACDALLVPRAGRGDDVPVLEAMACGLAVVAGGGARGLVEPEENGLAFPEGDAEAAAAALARVVSDAGLRARLRVGAARTAAAHDVSRAGPAAVEAFLRAAAGAGAPSHEERLGRAEAAAPTRRASEPAPAPARRGEPWIARAAAALRRAAGGAERRGGEAPAAGAAPLPAAGPGPGEPVVFAGQPRYFRSAYEDAVREGWGVEYAVRLHEKGFLDGLPDVARRTRARTCVAFDPWLLAERPAVVAALRADGVRLVAYSTEPVPHTGAARLHWDALRRLDNLRRARDAGFDLFLHHDPSSEGFLRAEGFAPLAVHPLPVSERLFFPEDAERDLDACFLGWSTPHREAFLAPLEGRFRTVHVAHGFFDEDARRLMNRSKVVVNLHAHDSQNFENRCVQALFCGRPLVSEEVSGGLLTAGADYLLARTPRELLDRVRHVVRGGEVPAPRFDRSRFLVSSLRALLAATRGGP